MTDDAPLATQVAYADPLAAAKLFHETYERLAPSFGYETRKETREFDPATPNGRLMVAVCGEVTRHILADTVATKDAEIKRLRNAIGVCVPGIIRCFIDYSREDGMDVDVELGEKVLARVEAALANAPAPDNAGKGGGS